MISNNLKITLQTTKGFTDINDLIPGDKLLEYNTNNTLTVENIKMSLNPHKVFKISLTDGREIILIDRSFVNLNGNLIQLSDILNSNEFPLLSQHQLEYSQMGIQKYLFPDPYIVGALLVNADFDDEFINLPLDRDKAIDLLFNKYHLKYGSIIKNNKVYFKKINEDCMITWKEFFKGEKIFPVTKRFNDPIIPDQFLFASINDRWQFVRGAFDVGYDSKMFPDNIALANKSEDRLKIFQKILWSLGILSRVTYDPYILNNKGRKYRLDILNSYEDYPGLFYNLENIRYILNSDNLLKHHDYFELKIKSIEYIGDSNIMYIETDKHLASAITSNYLPYVLI